MQTTVRPGRLRRTVALRLSPPIWAVLAAMLLPSLPLAALAGPYEDGKAALDRGDYSTAVRLFRLLGDGGSAAAQNNLGSMYERGQGLPQDYGEALKWYRKAADQRL